MTNSTGRFRPVPISALVAEICGASSCDSERLPAQVQYLADYLRHPDLGATSILVEEDYTDRHYLEEYVAYYATKLVPPVTRCVRLHVFSVSVDDAQVAAWLDAVATADEQTLTRLQQAISDQYVGFIVVRPHASAPIGRTLLRTYKTDGTERCYAPAMTRHDVHVLGLELTIRALPFQQQDRAVGACATTAIWTALSRVLKADGARSVTPFEITQAATRYVAHQRAIPADQGLTEEQINAAIRAFGYEPHHLTSNSAESKLLRICLKCYLASGIPVLLDVSNDDFSLRHAIVLGGYRPTDPTKHQEYIAHKTGDVELVTRNFIKVYAHDDRLGPYARMELAPRYSTSHEHLTLRFLLDPGAHEASESYADLDEELVVHTAIVPLYRKLRLTAEDLIRIACELLPHIRALAPEGLLTTEMFFSLGGKYLASALSLVPGSDRRVCLASRARFSRYVGVVRFFCGGAWFMDVVVDTTDIYRHYPRLGAVLAFVPSDDSLLPDIALICEELRLTALLV